MAAEGLRLETLGWGEQSTMGRSGDESPTASMGTKP